MAAETEPESSTANRRSGMQADFFFEAGSYTSDDLKVVRFDGMETLSHPFVFQLDIVMEESEPDFESILGQSALLTIEGTDGTRYVNGIVSRFEQSGEPTRLTQFRAELVPRIWLLGLRHKSRIFQDMSVPDIITKVLTEAKIPSGGFQLKTKRSYTQREYCVQYRESELAFISRLMEEEGLYYWFEHSKNNHVMVIGDATSAHVPIVGDPKLLFHTITGEEPYFEHIYKFRYAQEVRPGEVVLRDYDFKRPKLDLTSNKAADRDTNLQIYDYPGEYVQPSEGTALSEVRLQELQASRKVGEGASNCRRLLPGYKFTMDQHARKDFNREYLLTRVSHSGTQVQSLKEAAGSASNEYNAEFSCIPADLQFRPARVTPRPAIYGSQTAIVTGPAGEEIYPDEHGRVKAQFHWDREGNRDEKSSCWIRVSQEWAGKGWGATILPRIGHEVLVTFIEGDPDRPMVTGRVYNAVNVPPYPLPGEKTKSTLKSDSSKGGGNFNEIRLEDLAGSEQVFVHAAKDMDVRVLNDRREWVKNDRSLIVKRDRLASVERDDHATVGRDLVEEVKRDHHVKVTGKQAQEVGGSTSLKVKGDRIEVVDGAYSVKVTGDLVVKGTKIVLDASSGITLKVGGNFVTVDPSGVAIKGTLVQLNSGGSALSGSPGSPVSPVAPQAPVEAATAEPGKQPQARSASPTHAPQSSANQQKKNYIEIEMKDDEGNPMGGLRYAVVLPDGSTVADGTLDEKGYAKVENIDPGQCKVTFPDLHGDAWDNA